MLADEKDVIELERLRRRLLITLVVLIVVVLSLVVAVANITNISIMDVDPVVSAVTDSPTVAPTFVPLGRRPSI